jgi:hypothetical protein
LYTRLHFSRGKINNLIKLFSLIKKINYHLKKNCLFFEWSLCSWIRHIMWLIWCVGGDIRYMIVRQNSGFFGWILSLERLELVTLLPSITSTGSVPFQFIIVIRMVCSLHIQELCRMLRMDCCFITSKCFLFKKVIGLL